MERRGSVALRCGAGSAHCTLLEAVISFFGFKFSELRERGKRKVIMIMIITINK